ncbi:putative MFS family arabinose efflux permease [Brevibacterium sanguinis]|uniref:MFS family arabinose efflux permease n=2 Tax=Brevibacterium TaxID=1696 RepID=A0ABX9GRI0_9MICO|nr:MULTISPECIES: MFS transporter [Brevibacterium]RBP66070.1 putative MFS family arabinose efflux permease [Brevibacterium sanguinis]RBP72721.1 putative MFS family arabinose efflux permease [Brevibacterium celere]
MTSQVESPITPKDLRRTISASVVGTIAEYYDFFIYGTASALAFNEIFFPETDQLVGTLAAFATYAVGFFARPLGGLFWGHIGDRIGRKRALVFTLLLTGLGTFAVGLMPTYDTIGIWAAVILVIVRLIQGFGVGGEQGGAVLLTAEASPPNRRGFYASFVQLGSPVAYLIPTVLFAWLMGAMDHDSFMEWGWRVPFLLSIFVVAIGLYIRSRVPESKSFQNIKKKQKSTKAPLKVIMTRNRREVIGGMLTKFVEAAVFPFYTVFLVAYANNSGYNSQIILDAVIVAIICEIVAIPLLGRLTDKVGRKPVYLAAAVINLVLIWPAFLAVETENFAVIAALLAAGLALGHAGTYAPQASFFPELFPAQARYSGVSVVWQFGAMLASGPFTVVATALLVVGNGSYLWSALYVAALVIISIVAIQFLPETAPSRRDGLEYAQWQADDNHEHELDTSSLTDTTESHERKRPL